MRKAAYPVALSLVLLLAACSRKPAASVRVDPALAMLVPPGAVAIGGAKVEALRETPLFKRYVTGNQAPVIGEFIKRTGIDPRKDLWEVLVVSDGNQTALLARGKFTETGGLEPKMDLPGANRYPYRGYTIIGSEQGGVVFTNSTTAVAGRLAAIRGILDQRDNAKGIPPALEPLVRSVPSASQVWGATVGGTRFLSGVPLSGNLGNLNRLLASVQSAWFAADLRSGVDASGYLQCSSDKEAKQFHDAMRAVIGLGRLNTPDNQPEMLRFYDGIKVSQDGAKVNVAANLPQDLVEKFLAMVPR